jgi:hypothetical protein
VLLGTQTWYGVEAEGNEPQAGSPSPAPSPALFFPSLPCARKLINIFFLLVSDIIHLKVTKRENFDLAHILDQ